MDSPRRLNLTVTPEQTGWKVDELLRGPLALSGTVIRRVKRLEDGILLDGVRAMVGDRVRAGQTVGTVAGLPVRVEIDGILRGLLPDGTAVTAGMKTGDVDPRCRLEHCFTVSDKARAVGGGVLEAILHGQKGRGQSGG